MTDTTKKLNKILNEIQAKNKALQAKKNESRVLEEGTSVIMFDGTIKKVEDIVVGDFLMGEDSTSRKVISLTKREELIKRQKEIRDSRPKWMRKLSTKNIEHLKDGLEKVSLRAFKEAWEMQKRLHIECCECRNIAFKIGLEKEDRRTHGIQ
jgi:hypothetical protein